MGKIVLLVSREEMLHQAHNILQEKKYEIAEMRAIQTKDVVVEARSSIADGATIIIARGLQASLIKQYTNIPVVEIVITAQEMALLIVKAKQIIKKPKPVIAVVGFKNMFCDMSYFDMIYDIELRTYFAPYGAELKGVVKKAIEDQADLIIGGDTAVEVATEEGIPSLFLSITEDSLTNAFSMAESMDYAMNVEKKNAAQMETLLDYSFSGVIKMDSTGMILAVNPLMEDMLGQQEHQLTNRRITEVFPDVNEEAMRQVLEEGKEYSLFMQVNYISVFAVLAPVLVEERVDGVILTCHKMRKKQLPGKGPESKRSLKGMIALARFGDILQLSKPMQECVRLAKLYALSEKPVIILGEPGTEKYMIAQSIHNSSLQREGPFLDVPCAGLSDEAQRISIFGEMGAAVQVNGGSLLIQDIGYLTASNQYRLYQLIRYHICHGADVVQTKNLDVRVLVTTDVPLETAVKQGEFREDLYYLLSGLVVKIPPLRKRDEDLKKKIEVCIKDVCERYSRYHVLTAGAWKSLLAYPWKGNLFQIESFCERLILTAGSRSVDEIGVNGLLREMYPEHISKQEPLKEQPYECEQALEIRRMLEKYDGNREKTAKGLGISKATLWRHMKKYEIT